MTHPTPTVDPLADPLEARLRLYDELPAVLELEDPIARFAELEVLADAVDDLRARIALERGRVAAELRAAGLVDMPRPWPAVGELLGGITGERARQLATAYTLHTKETVSP